MYSFILFYFILSYLILSYSININIILLYILYIQFIYYYFYSNLKIFDINSKDISFFDCKFKLNKESFFIKFNELSLPKNPE